MPAEKTVDDLPYRGYEISCPGCGNQNTHERLSWDAFRINATEEDEHPTEIIWKNKSFSNTNPLQFFWAVCETCFYTAEIDDKDFRIWEKNEEKFRNGFLEGVLETHIDELKNSEGALISLGHDLDPDYPYESTINKFYLGIYSECLKRNPSIRDLARYYLRLAWIYRDRERFKSEIPRSDHESLLKIIQDSYIQLIPAQPALPEQPPIVFSEAQALKTAGKYYATAHKLVREIGVEGELKLLALIGEVNFRAYVIGNEEPVYELAKYYFNAGMKQAMVVVNDKEMDPANKNRARKMLDRIGTRGGALMKVFRERGGKTAPPAKKQQPKKKKGLRGLFS